MVIEKYGLEVVKNAQHMQDALSEHQQNASKTLAELLEHMNHVNNHLDYVMFLIRDADVDTQRTIALISEYDSWR